MILLLGGTSDARALAGELRAAGHEVLLSVVTEYGARLAHEPSVAEADLGPVATSAPAAVRQGALSEPELERLVREADAVVDATHPFAAEISRMAAAACGRVGRPYLRYERPAGELPAGVLAAGAADEAAGLAVAAAAAAGSGAGGEPPTILLTVGSKTVGSYASAARGAGVRVVARVLPTPESLAACAAAGLEPRDVVAMQGPTSAELDAALLRHLGAAVLVTKESGAAGGLGEKLHAAELAGATAVVVRRPQDPGAAARDAARALGPPEVLAWLAGLPYAAAAIMPDIAAAAAPEVAPAAAPRCLSRGLLQVYTGDGKGKTTAAVGLALRARGAGLAVAFVQFVKGGRESAELEPLRAAGVHVVRPAVKSSGLLRGAPTAEDRAAAAAAWAAARAALAAPEWDLVVLDELHAALRHGLVEQGEVLAALAARPPHQEVVTTGRGAPAELLAAAALVTEMTPIRHPYPDVPARRGVEF